MDPVEIEIKYYLPRSDPVRNRIIKLGAQSKGRFFEKNFRYEDQGNTLIKNRSLLRLRKDNKTTLTFKSPPVSEDRDFKVHNELEVAVDDFHTMGLILSRLGFHREQVYEKWRETFVFDDAILCMDQMPFGTFLEIESDRPVIKRISNRLKMPWDRRILLNYLGIFDIIKKGENLPFNDVTFDNFKDVTINFEDYLQQCISPTIGPAIELESG